MVVASKKRRLHVQHLGISIREATKSMTTTFQLVQQARSRQNNFTWFISHCKVESELHVCKRFNSSHPSQL